MTWTVHPQEFGPEDIRALLAALDARLARRGIAASVYVVGGAAIALQYQADRHRTGDVDALADPEAEVLAEAAAVAAEYQVRSTWLSTAARPWVPSPAGHPAPRRPGLTVRFAPPEHLLAMKVVAARGQRDMDDIQVLCTALGVSDADGLVEVVRDAYGEDAIEMVHGGMVDLRRTCALIARLLGSGSAQ